LIEGIVADECGRFATVTKGHIGELAKAVTAGRG